MPRYNRRLAFESPSPEGWRPRLGEMVYLRKRPGKISNVVSRGTVAGMGMFLDMLPVAVKNGGRCVRAMWPVEDMRPIERREKANG